MASKHVIAGEAFATKRAVAERVRRLLHESPVGPVRGQDGRFLQAYFRWHPNPEKHIDLVSKDFQAGAELPEPLLSRWRAFHAKHARLRLLPREINSKIGARDPAEAFGGGAA